jgi:Uma2 family endonuclease
MTSVVPGEARIVIRGVGWDLYDRLSDAISEGQHVYLAYDGEDLEIMTKGLLHEDYKDLLGRFILILTRVRGIRRRSLGETTWKRPGIGRGLEADQCYYFDPDKLAAAAEARARRSSSLADYPNPDLAIEVEISPSQVDRMAIYAALRVGEVWRFDGEAVVIEQLSPDGSYTAVERSRFMPVSAAEVRRWLLDEDSSDDLVWEHRLEEWARGLRHG